MSYNRASLLCDVDCGAHHHSGLFGHLVTFLLCTAAHWGVFWELAMKFIFSAEEFISKAGQDNNVRYLSES